MPKFNTDTLEQHSNPSGHYGYSAARIEDLTATEYTLVTIALDESGSTQSFKDDMEKCLQAIAEACGKSPRADNLMLRLVAFGSRLREVHGFKLLEQCKPDDYLGVYRSGGQTALYDAAYNSVESALTYAKQLSDNDFLVNGIVFVLTDGDDNASTMNRHSVREALQRCVKTEAMESLVSVLIGVNVTNQSISQYLDQFNRDAEFTQYVELANADAKTLAKLADFVSKSISSQSKSLGSGVASTQLTF